jgi:hypothetical protein
MYFGATQAGQITEITTSEKGESSVVIVNSNGTKTSQSCTSRIKFNC